jgi:pimeloyl-ACP methyl ester carboxylesterase
MTWGRGKRNQVTISGILVPRWLAFVSGCAGTVLGLATNLYSSAFRSAISESGRHVGEALYVVVATIVASAATAIVYRWLVRRRQVRAQILPGEITIDSSVLGAVADEHDSVAGRTLHFLEAKRDSAELVVFLHGLGLDANDFRPYMAESRFHCVALTLYGFNASEKDDSHYGPISLQTHVQLLGYALERLQRANPGKQLALVGFSFGADVIFLLPQFAPEIARRLDVKIALLLDPNVNHSTTTISSRIAEVDKETPVSELIKILESADNVREFRNLCEYLYKITAKNFGQIQRHAREMIEMWQGESYERFLDRLGQLSGVVKGVNVVLSFDYERHFNAIARGAVSRGLNAASLECSELGHFDLISPVFLRERLEGLVMSGDQVREGTRAIG